MADQGSDSIRNRLATLVDLGSLQVMADAHYKTTGMPVGIIDGYDNSVLVGAGWQDICVKFHRVHPETLARCQESDRTIKAHLEEGKPYPYKCRNGMWDIGMPIVVSGEHLATLFLGQFFYEDEIPDRDFFRSQARRFSFDESEYLSALDRIPVFKRQEVDSILEYDLALVEFITDLALKSLLQKEERKAREALELQLQQAQKMESIGRLAGGIAHDYNNMLGVIMGYSEMILNDLDEADTSHEAARQIYDASVRSLELNNKLLAFARKQTISPKVVDLNEAVSGTVTMLKRLIGEEIDLIWNPADELCPILIDPSQVDQILTNLCINARDAISGTGRISIETDSVVFDEDYCDKHAGFIPGRYVRLSVSDNGSGMSREVRTRLFEPFFTTKKVGKGTGLGLSMVYGAVRQNGGFIHVYSEPGMGSNFNLYFNKSQSGELSPPEQERVQAVEGGMETILLVEDDPMLLTLTGTMLERMGYRVIGAETPESALQSASEYEGEIHMLLSDVIMPGMNGREMSGRLKLVYPDIKQLFMSGYTAEIVSGNAVLEEGVNFIQKPFTNADLGRKIRDVLGRR
jgi:signal transduction histidine kinase